MSTARRGCSAGSGFRQGGAALLITLALLGVICGLGILWIAGSNATQAKRVQNSARAMGMIRDALIARAAADANRPGSLPCPDVNNDGLSLGPGPEWTGSTCTTYIGRVPWKTLDLPDLRDADGERFWYALSPVFRDSPSAGTLNSDTPGSLMVTGTPAATNVIAIIFAPGASLPGQNRDPANTVVMSELPHYLDGDNNNADATYQAGPGTATFNDELLVITREMLMPAVEQRVARQARSCLERFAQQLGAGGSYPFAAPINQPLPANWATFADEYPAGTTALWGRIPSTLTATNAALGAPLPPLVWPNDSPDPGGSATCFAGVWWNAWRELLLYRVSAAYAPGGSGDCAVPPPPAPSPCLSVNGQGNVKAVVIVAGRALTQPPYSVNQLLRGTNKTNTLYYLEPYLSFNNGGAFTGGSTSFGKAPRAMTSGSSFNDRVECLSESGLPPCD